jgi:hypothetical protein
MLPCECNASEAAVSCDACIMKNPIPRRDAMYRVSTMLLLIILFAGKSSAQELFINTEPASNMPTHSYGFTIGSESFGKSGSIYTRNDLEFMYEETSLLMTHVMIHASNYYGSYGYNNFGMYAKYRIYTDDGFKEHFRIALYALGAIGVQRNTFADVMLDGGNRGLETGAIFTLLQNRFALSSTLGAITFVPDVSAAPGITFQNVRNYDYSLSAGYLIYPDHYESYKDLNVNLYAELLGKYITYNKAEAGNITAEHGTVLDLAIGPQLIINSIWRIDLAVRARLISGVESFPKPSVLLRYEQMFYH